MGICCKDLARSNPKRWILKGGVLAGATSPGKTADTFWGLITLLDSTHCQATWIVIENSDLLLEEDAADWSTVKEALQCRSFYCRPTLVCSSQFGIPQARKRSYRSPEE